MNIFSNPVYKREIMVSTRSFRLALVLLVFNGILALVALLNMYSTLARVRITAEIQYSSFLDLYIFVAVLEFVMLSFIMPAITAGSISGERERQTLDLMLSTDCNGKTGSVFKYHGTFDCFQFPYFGSGVCVWRGDYEGHGDAFGVLCGCGSVCGKLRSVLLGAVSEVYVINGCSLWGDGRNRGRNLWSESTGHVSGPYVRGLCCLRGGGGNGRQLRRILISAAFESHGYLCADHAASGRAGAG